MDIEQAVKLKEKRIRYNEIMGVLYPQLEQTVSDDVQEQSRTYLSEDRYSYERFANKKDMNVVEVSDQYTKVGVMLLSRQS